MAKTPRADIAKVLAQRVSDAKDSKTLCRDIASYLVSEGRTADLEPILRDVMILRAEQGIVEVTAVSAHALTPEIRKAIEAQVKVVVPTAKKIIISERLQPDMLGGVRLELPDRQFDLSLRSKLSRFKQLTSAGR